MTDALIIWGAGGHGKVVLDLAIESGQFEHIFFLDENRARFGQVFCEHTIIGGPEKLIDLAGNAFVVAIGENLIRTRCFEVGQLCGLKPVVLVHSSAIVSPSATIERGTVVMPGAVINAGAVVGQNSIVNSGAVIEHDCEIGANVHISPRAVLGGAAKIGDFAHVGIGAVVLPHASIGEGTTVGAGAVVLKKAPAHCTVIGVPAREKEESKK